LNATGWKIKSWGMAEYFWLRRLQQHHGRVGRGMYVRVSKTVDHCYNPPEWFATMPRLSRSARQAAVQQNSFTAA